MKAAVGRAAIVGASGSIGFSNAGPRTGHGERGQREQSEDDTVHGGSPLARPASVIPDPQCLFPARSVLAAIPRNDQNVLRRN